MGQKAPLRRRQHHGPGLAKARSVALRHRQRPPTLSRELEELILELAERMSEGAVREAADGDAYFGSTMFSVNLSLLEARWRGPLPREELREVLEGSVRLRLRLGRIARAEAAHRAPARDFGCAEIETQMTLVDDALHFDVDIEMPIVAPAIAAKL